MPNIGSHYSSLVPRITDQSAVLDYSERFMRRHNGMWKAPKEVTIDDKLLEDLAAKCATGKIKEVLINTRILYDLQSTGTNNNSKLRAFRNQQKTQALSITGKILAAVTVEGNRLTHFEMSLNCSSQGCEITPDMMRIIVAGLERMPHLVSLSFANQFINKAAAHILAEGLKGTKIQHVDLQDTGLRGYGLLAILKALPHTNINVIDMSGAHYRSCLEMAKDCTLYGSLNMACGRAFVTAVKTSPHLLKVWLPKDEYLYNAKALENPSLLLLEKMVSFAHEKLKNRCGRLHDGIVERVCNERLSREQLSDAELAYLQAFDDYQFNSLDCIGERITMQGDKSKTTRELMQPLVADVNSRSCNPFRYFQTGKELAKPQAVQTSLRNT